MKSKKRPEDITITHIKGEIPTEELEMRLKQAVAALIKIAKS
jgi:hypothetical protein